MLLNIRQVMDSLGIRVTNITPGLILNKTLSNTNLEEENVHQFRLQDSLKLGTQPLVKQFSYCYVKALTEDHSHKSLGIKSINSSLLTTAYESLLNYGLLLIERHGSTEELVTRFDKIQFYKSIQLENKANLSAYVKTSKKISDDYLLPTNSKSIKEINKKLTAGVGIKPDKIKIFNTSKYIEKLKISYPINIADENLYWIIREGDKFVHKKENTEYLVTKVTYKSDYEPPIVEAVECH